MSLDTRTIRTAIVARIARDADLNESPSLLGPTVDPRQLQDRSFAVELLGSRPVIEGARRPRHGAVLVVQRVRVRVASRPNPRADSHAGDQHQDDIRRARTQVLLAPDATDALAPTQLWWIETSDPVDRDGVRYSDLLFGVQHNDDLYVDTEATA